ncbi:unnamed protein product, partial [Iphiclides podalirius]
MKVTVLILTFSCGLVFGHNYDRPHAGDTGAVARAAQQLSSARRKREAVGALDIVTNNAQPIHAEVKPENGEVGGKKCSKSHRKRLPSKIEPGVVFQVTPPKTLFYEAISLRKSLPLTSKLDLIRGKASSESNTQTMHLILDVINFKNNSADSQLNQVPVKCSDENNGKVVSCVEATLADDSSLLKVNVNENKVNSDTLPGLMMRSAEKLYRSAKPAGEAGLNFQERHVQADKLTSGNDVTSKLQYVVSM